MGWLKRTKRIPAQQVEAEYPIHTIRRSEDVAHHYRPRDLIAIEAMKRASGVVWQCADTNASVCSAQPLRLYRRVDAKRVGRKYAGEAVRGYMASGNAGKSVADFVDGGGEFEVVDNHPAIDLLKNPGGSMNGTQLAWLRFFSKEMTGKAYTLVGTGESGLPVMLEPLLAQFTEIMLDADGGGLVGFKYARSEQNPASYDLDEVMYFRHAPSPFNPYDGVGPLQGVIVEADLLVSVALFDKDAADNGYQPGGIVSLPENAQDDQVKAFAKQLRAKGGPGSGSKIFVTRGAAKLEPLSWPPKELKTGEQIDRYEKRIRQAFGHTESMADSNSSTYASAVVGYSEQYMGAAIRPRLARDAAELTENLCALYGMDPNEYCFVYDDPVVSDVEATAARMVSLRAASIMSINETRSELGLERIEGDENADDPLYQPSAAPVDPFGGLLGGSPQAAQEPAREAPSTETREYTKPETKQLSVKSAALSSEITRWVACTCGDNYHKAVNEDDVAADPLLDEIFNDFGDDLESTMEGIVADMQDELLDAARGSGSADTSALVAQAEQVMLDQLTPVVDATVESVRQQFKLDDDAFSIVNEQALEFLKTHVSRVASDIDQSTRDIIQTATRNGLEQGLTIDEVASQIEGVPAYRAERIARTELQDVTQGARVAAWDATGEVEYMKWVNAPGASTAHKMIAQRTYVRGQGPGVQRLGEPFVKAGETLGKESFDRDIYRPPARPNCRCNIRPILRGES